MKSYSEKLKDPRWQRKRLEVMSRDGFKCRDCGAEDETLHVHHCCYIKGDPWNTRTRYMLTLCENCHEERQALEDDARIMLGGIMAECPDVANLVVSLAKIASQQKPVLFLFSDNDWFAKKEAEESIK